MSYEQYNGTMPGIRQKLARITAALTRRFEVFEPSVWLQQEPDAEGKMLADGDIAHAVNYRCELVGGPDWQLTPRVKSDPASQMAVQVGTELISSIDDFTSARELLARSFFHGSRFGHIRGEMRKLRLGDGKLRTWWVPYVIEDLPKEWVRRVPIRGDDGEVHELQWERWLNSGGGQWVPETPELRIRRITSIHQNDAEMLGFGRALREPLAEIWWTKQKVKEAALKSIDRHAGGVLDIAVDGVRAGDGKVNREVFDEWLEVGKIIRGGDTIVRDLRDQISILPANGEGWQIFREFLDMARAQINTLVLGANLTTSADKGGSYALAEVQEYSTQARVRKGRKSQEEYLTRDLVGCVWKMNHANLVELGIADQKPRFSIAQEKHFEPSERVTVAQGLHAMGVRISAEDLYEQTGFRKPEEGEEVIEGQVAVPSLPGFGLQ